MTSQPALFRGKADARINGVACRIKLVLQPLGEEIAGVIGLPDHHPEPLVGFSLQGQALRFIDLPGDEQALRKTFGVPPHEVRGCLCRLATEMLFGSEVRQLTPGEEARLTQPSPGATVH